MTTKQAEQIINTNKAIKSNIQDTNILLKNIEKLLYKLKKL